MCVIIKANMKNGPNSYTLFFDLCVKCKRKWKQWIKNHIRTNDKACLRLTYSNLDVGTILKTLRIYLVWAAIIGDPTSVLVLLPYMEIITKETISYTLELLKLILCEFTDTWSSTFIEYANKFLVCNKKVSVSIKTFDSIFFQ